MTAIYEQPLFLRPLTPLWLPSEQVFNEFSFSMFYSQPPYADLIFQDATQKIEVLDMGTYSI
jgi:hypothetical protein